MYEVETFYDVHSELVRGLPTFEPLDPRETADHLRAGDDASIVQLISDYLQVAREWVENDVRVSLGQRTVTLYLDEFPDWDVEIRLPPLQSVASVVYLDDAGSSTTLSGSLYRVDATSRPGRITPAYGQTWPCTYQVTKAITITATVGYTDATLVPACAKQAMRILAKMMFDGGGLLCEDGIESVRRILDPLRWEGYA